MNQTRSVSRGVLTPLVLAGAFAAAAFFTATPARAYSPEYELDVFGGVHLWHPYNSIGRRDPAGGSDISSLTQFNHGGGFGVRLGLGLHKRFMLESELAILPTVTPDVPFQELPRAALGPRRGPVAPGHDRGDCLLIVRQGAQVPREASMGHVVEAS